MCLLLPFAGTNFVKQMQQDVGAFRSWCDTCGALCTSVFDQLRMVGSLANLLRHPDPDKGFHVKHAGALHAAAPAHPNLQRVQRHASQQHPELQNDATEQPADTQGWAEQSLEHSASDPDSPLEIRLGKQVLALLPVMAAAALQLACAALACVRLMNTKVFTSGWAGMHRAKALLSHIPVKLNTELLYTHWSWCNGTAMMYNRPVVDER
jgi:hypothetical protein